MNTIIQLQKEISWQELQEVFHSQTLEEQEELKNITHEYAIRVNEVLDMIKKINIINDTNQNIANDLISWKLDIEWFKKLFNNFINSWLLPSQVVKTFFDKNEWDYETREVEDKDKTVLLAWFCWKVVSQKMLIIINDKSKTISLRSKIPNEIPEDKRNEVMEFITRANYWLNIWWFQMDLSDWDISYDVWIDVEDWVFSDEMVKNLIWLTKSMVDKYYPGLMMVLFWWKTPEEAIKEIEKK